MNKIRLLVALALIAIIAPTTKAQIDHLEPPFWWAGMEHSELQLLVHAENISGSQVSINYSGVKISSVVNVENQNYLFINLELSQEVIPGKFDIDFINDGKKLATYEYELKERESGSAERDGFDNSDVLYLIMPDRFANGDTSNDEVNGMKEGLNRQDRYGRHGGDIKGISDNLDYINDMGFTAIWLNPVLENDQVRGSYHGYAATDFYKVDRRFGANDDYRQLGMKAREKGIKLIMDMIFNHCGSEHWWMKDLPASDWLSTNEYKRTSHRRTVNHDPHASRIDRDEMVDGWFVQAMPDLNQSNPFMATYLIQNSIWWIEYVGLAGIRMDTYPYPDKYMMAEWNQRVIKEYPDFNIVGEEWSLNPVIVSYWQKNQTNHDGYDGEIRSMMDFPLQSAVQKALTEEESFGTGMITLYDALANDIVYPDPDNLVIFPDNHDMPRFFMQVGMDVNLFRLGITYFLTTRGIPQIFYGTEILMTHTEGDDHGYIRKDFPGGWSGDNINAFTGKGMNAEALEMQEYFKNIMNWRKSNPVMHTGIMTHFVPQNGAYVYFRHDKENIVMVILNKNPEVNLLDISRFEELIGDRTVFVDVISGHKYPISETLDVPGLSSMILELK